QDNRKKIRVMKVDADIEIETKRKTLINSQVENEKKLADSNKYKLQAQLEPYKDLDWKIISALSPNKSAQTDIAIAFRELAENAQNIQNLNITPDLLQSIVEQK
ncbi:MAG: membrane protease subunit, stomatin/prohibitin, partial [Bacteroidota bacterium]|nr:membrane protease subunit, stomatin/prohibitin [Bacteroidota bacterium]